MAHIDNLKFFRGGGLDKDNAPEYVAPVDWMDAYNLRVVGTTGSEYGYGTNPESNTLISGERAAGINKGIGGRSFEDIRQIVMFIYNSAGFHQLAVYDADSATQKIIYTDKTDSDGIPLLNLNPQYYVNCILLNETFLVWADGYGSVGYTNLKTLSSGGYGTVLAEDLSLIKPQNLIPITGVYVSDAGKASNFLKNKLFQFTSQYVSVDFNYSTWGTWSKRIIPQQESTPTEGTNVNQNNCIIVSVDIGSIRATQLNIACRESLYDFNIIKTVDRAYIVALPDTTVDIPNQIYESYDPATNLYSFVYYNESLTISVPATETDQLVDYVPLAATGIEKINNNIIALGNLKVGYDRPKTAVSLVAVGYDPNISVPNDTESNPLRITDTFPGATGSGAGNHQRFISVTYTGIPHTNDVLTITTYDFRNATVTQVYTYIVPAAQDGHIVDVLLSFAHKLPSASVVDISGTNTTLKVTFVGLPYNQLQSATVTLFNSGPDISKSIHAVLDNSSYQPALSYRDQYGRLFPLQTDNSFIVNTPSFAQLNGLTPRIAWTISSPPPAGAVDYQWLLPKNATTETLLDVFGCLLNYLGAWNAHNNTPTLVAGTGTVGDTYQITDPSINTDNRNLGNGQQDYNTGDYVVYNGKSWDIVPKAFADLTTTGDVLAIKINPLNLFTQKYTNSGVDPVLTYDYVAGDRCTLHYYIDPTNPTVKVYLNDPCIDVDVFGYDPATFLVKVQKSSSFDPADLAGKDIFLRLYSPNTQQPKSDVTTDNTTVWYEIGDRYPIVNGVHSVLNGFITDGDVYFKTRSYAGAVDPNALYNILATDFNFSDFYPSAFTSYGRPRAYYDVLETTEQKATIIYSQNYVLGSRKNGLNRFYAENQYGESDGQTSSSYGSIQIMWQRGDILEIIQELRVGSIPVFRSITEDLIEQKQYAISQKLLNIIRYSQTASVGIGLAKESFCFKDNNAFFIDPHRSEPYRYGLDGLQPISGKMSKYFKSTLQLAYAQGRKLVMYYNMFYDEVMLCIQAEGGVLTFFPFNDTNWSPYEPYTIAIGDITGVTSGAHATVVNNGDGTATFTPTAGYVGNNTGVETFNVAGNPTTKNICLNWIAGDSTPNTFSFADQMNQQLSTVINSNIIGVNGINIASPISITGGQYNINGGAWTSTTGTVVNGDSVQVRQTSSASNNTTTTATLTIGGVSANFNVKTILSPTTVGVVVVDIFSDTTLNVSGFVDTVGVTPYRQLVHTGANFTPGSTTPAADNWALASDLITGSGTLSWRFEFNLTKLLNTYPSITSFVFKIKGRDVTAGSISGAYSVKSASDGQMTMSGSPGSYVPGITGTSIGSPISYSGKTTVGGADGTYGYGVGADILVFTYDVTTNTLTLA